MEEEEGPFYAFAVTVLVKGTTDDFRYPCMEATDEEDAARRAVLFFRNYEHLEVEVVSVEYVD